MTNWTLLFIVLSFSIAFGALTCTTSSKTYCDGSNFDPLDDYMMVEGDVGLLFKGYVRTKYTRVSSKYDVHEVDSIGIQQMGYEDSIDTKLNLTTRMFTLDYSPLESSITQTYVALNSYDGCVIAMHWLDDETNTLTLKRSVYSIKTHLDHLNSRVTEWHAISEISKEYSYTNTATVKSTYHYPQYSTHYYYHPGEQIFFYFIRYPGNNYIIVTKYTGTATTACTTDLSGDPTLYSIDIPNTGANTVVQDKVFFFEGFAYIWTRGNTYDTLYRLNYNSGSPGSSTFDVVVQYSTDAYTFGDVAVLQNYGLIYTRKLSGSEMPGFYLQEMDKDNGGIAQDDSASDIPPELVENTKYWKLYQTRVDEEGDRPIYAITTAEAHMIYRITTIATVIYTGDSAYDNFLDAPIDFGRYHMIAVYPGSCGTALASADYDYIQVKFYDITAYSDISSETDNCLDERDVGSCGNAIVDAGETCDDGIILSSGTKQNGCDDSCQIMEWWRCTNSPMATRSLCVRTKCGNGVLETADPENEECDDGTHDNDHECIYCQKQTQYTWCSWPGEKCEHICGNGVLDGARPGPPENLEEYLEEKCDDGNNASGDGCQHDCQLVEQGYECLTAGSACTHLCGNGHKDSANLLYSEEPYGGSSTIIQGCDDGNGADSDGCSSTCYVEFGYICYYGSKDDPDETLASVCEPLCGNNIEDTYTYIIGTYDSVGTYSSVANGGTYTEECDDGNSDTGDGCENCLITPIREECLASGNEYNDRMLWEQPTSLSSATKKRSLYTPTNPYYLDDYPVWWLELYRDEDYIITPEDPYANRTRLEVYCYLGDLCDECIGFRIPGYPFTLYKHIYFSDYTNKANTRAGKIVLFEIPDTKVFAITAYKRDTSNIYMLLPQIKRDGGKTPVGAEYSTLSACGMRQSFGQFYIQCTCEWNSTTNPLGLQIYFLKEDSDDVSIDQGPTTTKEIHTYYGAPFFTYWPYWGGIIFSPQIHGRIWDSFLFGTEQQQAMIADNTDASNMNELLLQIRTSPGQWIYSAGLKAYIEPVFGRQYYAYFPYTNTSSTKEIQRIYMSDVGGSGFGNTIDTREAISGCSSLYSLSMYYKEATSEYVLLATCSNNIIEISDDLQTQNAITSSFTATDGMVFIQRPRKDEEDIIPPPINGYNYPDGTTLFLNLYYDTDNSQYTFEDSIELPEYLDKISCTPASMAGIGDCPGRFNLKHFPSAFGERYFVHYYPMSCEGHSRYQWDYLDHMSLNIVDMIDKVTFCYDLDDSLWAP